MVHAEKNVETLGGEISETTGNIVVFRVAAALVDLRSVKRDF